MPCFPPSPQMRMEPALAGHRYILDRPSSHANETAAILRECPLGGGAGA